MSEVQGAESAAQPGYPDWSRPEVRQEIRIELLRPDPSNPRTTLNEGKMQRLIKNIARRGISRALLVRRGDSDRDVIVMGGNRRLYAAQRAGLTTVPCRLVNRVLGRGEVLREIIWDNEFHEEVPPIDRAVSYAALMEADALSVDAFADEMDLTRSGVNQLLALLRLPEAVQKAVNEGRIPVSSGYQLSRLKGRTEPELIELAVELAAGRLHGKDIKDLASAEREADRTAGLDDLGPVSFPRPAEGAGRTAAWHGTDRRHYLTTHHDFACGDGITVTVVCSKKRLSGEEISRALDRAKDRLQVEMRKWRDSGGKAN